MNHPDVVASDTCSYCGKAICYNCRMPMGGWIFCSFQCLTLFMVQNTIKALFGLIGALFRPLKKLKRVSWRGWAEIVLTAGLLIGAFYLRRLTLEMAVLKGDLYRTAPAAVDSLFIEPPKIIEPVREGMVRESTLNIRGEAEPDHIVSLSVNGKPVEAVLPRGREFVFEKVRLHRGINRLEVRAISPSGGFSTLQTLMIDYASPTLSYLSEPLNRGSLLRKEVALTFDGGGSDNAADEILNALKKEGVRSTFFLTGQFIRQFPRTVRRIVREGHEVGNHTWTHPHLTTYAKNRRHQTIEGMTEEILHQEFSKTASLFKLVTGKNMAGLWRAPYGEINAEILLWAANAGYKHVGWTVGRGWEESMDTLDWVADTTSQAYYSAEEIVRKILQYGKQRRHGSNGIITLMHLGTERENDFPHLRLTDIIAGLRDQGCRFVTVTEMLE